MRNFQRLQKRYESHELNAIYPYEVSKAIVPVKKTEAITDIHLVNLMQYYDLVNELRSI